MGSVDPKQKAVDGFAHRFRPTYAGANMGQPYGVVETLAGLRASARRLLQGMKLNLLQE